MLLSINEKNVYISVFWLLLLGFFFEATFLEDGPTVYKLDYLQMDYIKFRDIKKNYISNLSYIP